MDPIRIDRDITTSMDFENAIATFGQGNLFPSQVAWHAARNDDQLTDVVRGTLEHGYRPSMLEVVRVPKLDRSTRPAVDMPCEDAIVYSTFCDAVRTRVHPGLVTFTGLVEEGQSYADFEHFPLEQPDAAYVLEADVASFYEYIDHQTLAEQILGLTGDPGLADGIADLLERWMGRAYGLPQGPPASAILADVYVSAAARTLARAGLRFSRYSDDFRIVARNWPEARNAQLILETALRSVGLVIAPRKLRTPKIDTYRAALERANDPRVRPLLHIPAAEDLLSEGYPEEAPDIPSSETQARDAEDLLAELTTASSGGVIETRLIRAALRRLRSRPSELTLSRLDRLLVQYPHLTPAISSCLRAWMGTGADAATLTAIEAWLRSSWFRYPWQVGWVLNAANYSTGTKPTLGQYASDAIFDPGLPWFARAQAAITAARHSELPPIDRYFDAWERASDAARPDLLAAVTVGDPPWRAEFTNGARVSHLLSKVADLPADQWSEWL